MLSYSGSLHHLGLLAIRRLARVPKGYFQLLGSLVVLGLLPLPGSRFDPEGYYPNKGSLSQGGVTHCMRLALMFRGANFMGLARFSGVTRSIGRSLSV